MFNLFLSSKELFHSNFIAWLITIDPEQLSLVFTNLVGRKIKIESCDREKKNFDLFIHGKDGIEIIIENKFKSIIEYDQLEKYNKTNKNPDAIKILLTLNAKAHEEEVSERAGWQLVSYEKLIPELEKTQLKEDYHQSLLKDYCDFVPIISNHFSNMDFLNTTISEMIREYQALSEVKLHDIYQKILFSFLLGELKNRLEKSGGKFELSCGNGRLEDVSAWQGFTRGTGLVLLNYRLVGGENHREGTRLELQLQFNRLKLMFIHDGDPEKLGDEILEPYFKILENFACPAICEVDKKNNVVIYPTRKGKAYNRYGKTAIYHNIKLSNKLTMNEIIDLMVQIFGEIMVYGEKYRKRF